MFSPINLLLKSIIQVGIISQRFLENHIELQLFNTICEILSCMLFFANVSYI